MSQSEVDQIKNENKLKLCKAGYLKYLILKFRMKISFIALKKQMTVLELFCYAILKSYQEMIEEGAIRISPEEERYCMRQYSKVLDNYHVRGLLVQAARLNLQRMANSKRQEKQAQISK